MKISRPQHRPLSNRCRGAALIAVLSVLGLLTVLALGALSAARRQAQLAHTSFSLIQQRELADSALRLFILELVATDAQARASGWGQRRVEMFGQTVSLEAQLESGRIDLNYASESLLLAVFAGNDLNESQARRLAARVIDWRDADDIAGAQGAERNDYRLARRTGPRNGPFESISELGLLLEGDSVPDRVLDAFTVYSHVAEAREDAAVPAVMNALRWAHARKLDGRTWLSEAAGVEPVPGLGGEVVRLRACIGAQPPQVCRTSVFRLTGDRLNPTLVFTWQ